jgi:hypothetical protein
LARRPEPEIQTDRHGYKESRLLNSFTCIALCVEPADDVAAVCRLFRENESEDFQTLKFQYHGKMHFGWAACVLEPNTRTQGPEFALAEMSRMLECVRVAHTFLCTCEAFEKLFLDETLTQADSYVKGIVAGPAKAMKLNRLRTLALAVVSLTSYGPVALADEDQQYFRCWERYAKIETRHRRLQQQCEILYNVQEAESQAEEARRQRRLNGAVLVLTALTLISVLVESYEFVREDQHWLLALHRLGLLACVLALLVVVVISLLRLVTGGGGGGRRGARGGGSA